MESTPRMPKTVEAELNSDQSIGRPKMIPDMLNLKTGPKELGELIVLKKDIWLQSLETLAQIFFSSKSGVLG